MATSSRAIDPTWPYPMTREQIKALDDELYEVLVEGGCDGTMRHTRAFLEARGLPIPKLTKWFKREGGYCDCEVYLNVVRALATW